MSNTPFIPEASDPHTYVRGRLVPPLLARQVKRGWKVGIAYVVLKVLTMAVLFSGAPSGLVLLLGAVEVGVTALLVYGIYRWQAWAAWALLGVLFLSAFAGAFREPGVAAVPYSPVGIVILVILGVLFGRAALAIRAFNHGG